MPSDPGSNIDTVYALASGRKVYHQNDLDMYEQHGVNGSARRVGEDRIKEANLISSELAHDRHMPVIDCDFPIQAIPSSTPGHYHLYVDKELTWQQYKALLDGMLTAGLIQKGWYDNAMKDSRTYVRLPHIKKQPPVVDTVESYSLPF